MWTTCRAVLNVAQQFHCETCCRMLADIFLSICSRWCRLQFVSALLPRSSDSTTRLSHFVLASFGWEMRPCCPVRCYTIHMLPYWLGVRAVCIHIRDGFCCRSTKLANWVCLPTPFHFSIMSAVSSLYWRRSHRKKLHLFFTFNFQIISHW